MAVLIYSTPTCPYCHMAKDFFKKHNVEYKDVNVAADENALRDMITKSGQMGVPVIDVNGQIIVGFDKEGIAAALNIKE